MAAAAHGSFKEMESWLPIEFLAVETEKLNKNHLSEFKKHNFTFPIEFPYEFDSFGCSSTSLSSPDESVAGSPDIGSIGQDDVFAGLTRRLIRQLTVKTEKMVMAGSPESTIGGIGSWSVSSNGSPNKLSSPPRTPFEENNAWNLYYAASGEVARLKMSRERNNCNNFQERGFLGSFMTQNQETKPQNQTQTGFYSNQNLAHCVSQKNQGHSTWGRQQQVKFGYYQAHQNDQLQCLLPCCGHNHDQQLQSQSKGRSNVVGCGNGIKYVRPSGLPRSEWRPYLHVQSSHHHHSESGTRAVFLGGYSNVNKKRCAGTGVFLPRRYSGNNSAATTITAPPESKKNSACSTVLLPAKVVQALNLNSEGMDDSLDQPHLSTNFASDYDSLVAGRRNNVLAQQERILGHDGVPLKRVVRLPQEWSY